MTKILAKAIEAASVLPDPLQDEIGQTVLEHVRRLTALQAEVRSGLESLAKTGGRTLNQDVWQNLKSEAKRRISSK
jgi:hypothetical protein